jgi:N-acetylglucosaminyldiphosphoundecaprenol N-acetyl-beta-D-mannosaminyltransferase
MTAVQLPPDPPEAVPESVERHPVPPRKEGRWAERRWMVDYGSRRILGMRVDGTTYEETTDAITDMASARSGGMVCVATVHMVMEAFDDPGFRQIVNTADRVTPDGVPLVTALRMLGIPLAKRVYGPALTLAVCQRAEELGLPVGFYGGTPEVVDVLTRKLSARFPKLEIPFAFAPPFRPLSEVEDAAVVDAIRAAGVAILFVGLGCPKQERWMAAHRELLRCTMVGVGAAFDFIAGAKRQAPRCMQRAGLEWLFRLLAEPRRLWRRYLIGNPRFLYHFALERWRARRGAPPPRMNRVTGRRDTRWS